MAVGVCAAQVDGVGEEWLDVFFVDLKCVNELCTVELYELLKDTYVKMCWDATFG